MPDGPPETLRRFDTCILADAMDRIGAHLRNQNFTHPGLQRFGESSGSIAGYAATARIRTSDPPLTGHSYFRHSEWWKQIDSLPRPRIVVIEDIDRHPGAGACLGQVGAAVFHALHCVGAITNGSVREIDEISALGFAVHAAHLSPSRAYAHLIGHGSPVEICGLRIETGDLLVADRYGVLRVPQEEAAHICEVALEIQERKRTFMGFCAPGRFSLEQLDAELRELHS